LKESIEQQSLCIRGNQKRPKIFYLKRERQGTEEKMFTPVSTVDSELVVVSSQIFEQIKKQKEVATCKAKD